MNNGNGGSDYGDFDDDPTWVDNPALALDVALRRVAELAEKVRANLSHVRGLDSDAREFLARSIYRDFLRLGGEIEAVAPLVMRSLVD